ncbi:MAG TPA: four helix bundle protein [Bacteroidota bacterium]|nr:four helix bundle protein [Bacteroidota bacterium]
MKYDLEERLINFAIGIIDVVGSLPKTRVGNHLAGQLIRSGTSPALNYGEVQAAESRSDFVHKMKVVLKELKETRICLTIIGRKRMARADGALADAADECRQLIAIFAKSIGTAESGRKS